MNKNMKCSQIEHGEIDAITFCQECKVYFCNKCDNFHSQLFKNHNIYNLDKNFNEIFIDLCKEENHCLKMEYFCKNHNQLCCVACIAKIKGKGNGQHTDCNVCFINDIKEEKKNKLKENIKNLENLSETFTQSISELKELFEKVNENKENLKIKIQKIFTKIRNELNNREEELILEVDKKYEKTFNNEDIIKEWEKLPNKIKLSLERGKKIDKDWKDKDKINSLINDCINIENNIKEINKVNEKISQFKENKDKIIKFNLEDDEIEKFIETIKIFGDILFEDKLKQNEIDSKIILKINDINFLNERLKQNFNDFEYNLIYRATRDGPKIDEFNKKCNGKNNQLIILRTTKGLIFGGFTGRGFQNTEKRKIKDDSVFLFSLDNKKIYNIKKDSYAIYEDSSCHYGIFFGKGDGNNPIYLGWKNCDMLLNNSSCSNKENEEFNFSKDYELNGGEQFFNLQEIEVFQINKK